MEYRHSLSAAVLFCGCALAATAAGQTATCPDDQHAPLPEMPTSCPPLNASMATDESCPLPLARGSQLLLTVDAGKDLTKLLDTFGLKPVGKKNTPRETFDIQAQNRDARERGLLPAEQASRATALLVTVNDAGKAAALGTNVARGEGLISAQPRRISIDPLPLETAGTGTTASQWYFSTISADTALQRFLASPAAARKPLVGILDTGVDTGHVALKDRIWRNPANGRMGVSHMNCAVTESVADSLGHGTHVAGIIAGEQKGFGRALMPTAQLINLQVTGDKCVDTHAVRQAIGFLVDNNAAVANLSWKSRWHLPIHGAISGAKDILFVTAIGNRGTSTDRSPEFPASFDLPNLISVAGSGTNDEPPPARGGRIDIAAPGQNIYTTKKGGGWEVTSPGSGSSSLAVPMVSATALMIRALAPDWTPAQVRRYLIDSADYPPSWQGVGYGRLNMDRATAAPVVIDWPGVQHTVDSSKPEFKVRLRRLFSSTACSTLDAELLLDDGSNHSVLPLATVAASADYLPVSLPPGYRLGTGKLRLRCSGTGIGVESGTFSIKNICVPPGTPI